MTRESFEIDTIHQWNDRALTLLYRTFYKALVAFSAQIVGEQAVAEEIVQDIFVKTWQKKNTYQSEGALKAYLYNAVRNESISHMRHQHVERSRLEAFERDFALMQETDTDSTHLHREEAYRQLLLAIEALSPKLRELFLLTIKGKTSKEIAEEMGITLNTVKKQRQRGLERLRDELTPESLLLLMLLLR